MNQEAALVNQDSAGMNQSAALVGQTSALTNQGSALLNQTTGIEMTSAAGVNAGAGAAMNVAAGEMVAAAATMAGAAAVIAGGGLGAGVSHAGGMIGNISAKRTVPASTFVGAPRLHNGLADDEFAMIAERGEVVLTKDNVAEMKDSAGEGSGGRGSIVHNNFNMSSIDAKGMSALFKKYRRQVANAQATAGRENNRPARRGR